MAEHADAVSVKRLKLEEEIDRGSRKQKIPQMFPNLNRTANRCGAMDRDGFLKKYIWLILDKRERFSFL